jgi:hypothetical protein
LANVKFYLWMKARLLLLLLDVALMKAPHKSYVNHPR